MSNKDKQKLSPQTRKLLDYLKVKKTITAVEARAVFQIEALPRRIADLKEAGWDITSTLKKDAQGKRYARYTFNGKAKGQVDSKGMPKVLESEKPKLELKEGSRIKIVRANTPGFSHSGFPPKRWYSVGDTGTVLRACPRYIVVRFDTSRCRALAWRVATGDFEVIANG